eukprot:148879_1
MNELNKSNSMISTAQSLLIPPKESLIIATPVAIRGRRLRQILSVLPIDVMEVQMLAREFFSRCDLQEKYMSLDKCAETFGISPKIGQGVYTYIRTNDVLDDVPFNYARKLALLYQTGSHRNSVIEDVKEWSRIYGQTQQEKLHLHTPPKSILQLPRIYLTFENFVEVCVYLSPRASMQQRFDLAFNIFDANADGVVDIGEIKSVMMDSLQSNLRHNGSDSKDVEHVFRREVDELINDLKTQYRADHFTKEEFTKFAAHGGEFLNCFTVNKHWLRDILGDNKESAQYARPQDAEMKGFLEAICEEDETIDTEQIIDLQETLRDHLVDTVDDLKTMKVNHFNEMNINRRVSTAICRKIKSIKKSEKDDEYQDFDMGMAPAPLAIAVPLGGDILMPMDDRNCIQRITCPFSQPSTLRMMQCMFVSLYLISIIISLIIDPHHLAKVSVFGCYLCLFLAPLSSYYPFITRWFTLRPNSLTAHCILYFTSREAQRINAIFSVLFALSHVISYHVLNGSPLYNVTGIIVCVLGMIALIAVVWSRRRRSDRYKQSMYMLWKLLKLGGLLAFIIHASHAHDPAQYYTNIVLLISIMPSVAILILRSADYVLSSKRMEVVLARNERPNFLLLSIKNKQQFLCGQYIEINCPAISAWQYHPFYITSSPDSQYMNVSVLSCGDWTQKLWQLYLSSPSNDLYDLRICGPYGIGFSTNKMNYNYDYLLIVAAGDGGSVECVASLLNFVTANFLQNDKHPIRKVYCYWMVSADDGCYWFYKLLRDLRNGNPGKFFPYIFVTSSSPDKSNAFGLNFFLSLRKESLQTNLVTQQLGRLSAGRISTFRKPVSIFAANANNRSSRFHNAKHGNSMGLLSELHQAPIDSKHGLEIGDKEVKQIEEDIPMQSPDFRNVLNKIREELLRNNNMNPHQYNKVNLQSNHSSKLHQQNSLHGILPSLVVASSATGNSGRASQVGTFFVGSELLEYRLKHLSQQFTDHLVIFEFNSIIVGNQYANRYSS